MTGAAAWAGAAPVPVVREPSRASAKAAAVAKRASGSLASAVRMTAVMSGGRDGRTVEGSGTGPVSRARATDAAESPTHGRSPVSSSYRTMPSEKMSEAAVADSPRACSGLK